jgi:hypothetical protein
VCTGRPGYYIDSPDSNRRSAYFVHDGARPISESELRAVQQDVRAAGVPNGLGGCCSGKVAAKIKASCLKVWPEVCSLPMSRIVQSVDEALKRRGLGNVRVGVDVQITGFVGPRCEATDPECGPLSSRDWDRPDAPPLKRAGCVAGRVRSAAPNQVTPGHACAHDGECTIGACGAECLRWDQLPGQMWCQERGLIEQPPVRYCGCLAGRCDWFGPAPQ